jgi:glycosyltransferase involved in cell wall biosynthesis
MRIAQIAPLAESVPPRLYGGTERVVSYLTEELVRIGHQVTLFASADSRTLARLVGCAPRALRLDARVLDPLPWQLLQLERVRARAGDFDVLHFHIDHLHLPLFRPLARRTVTTLHGRLDLPDLPPLYAEFAEMPLVSISRSQRDPLPGANWVGTVYHGLARDVCRFSPAPAGGGDAYLAFLGRVSPEKGLDRAIAIARRAGMRLRIAAKIDAVDEGWFRARIAPQLSDPAIEFLGEIDEAEKARLLGGATALAFPIDWPEPFGLAMIEAMSCGTPVVAFPRGAAREIVEEGVTGWLAGSIDEAAAAARAAGRIDRAGVRDRFEERFSAARMARDYLAVYRSLGRVRQASTAA